ncbi:MAG TPA: hypothetical protein EYO39_03710 [Nitrospirales bacterium]|nr:hypothetical protein [Nitrospirales bacterium]
MVKLLIMGVGLFFLLGVGLADADVRGLEDALKHMNVALAEVEKAVKHARQGQAEEMTMYSHKAIQHAQQAIEVLPAGNPHGREAYSLLKEAIANLTDAVQLVDGGHTKKAADRVHTALDFADAAISHLRHSH